MANSSFQRYIAAMSLASTSCMSVAVPSPQPCDSLLSSLARQDPVAQAEAAMASGAPYFLGVHGFTIRFPGVEDAALVESTGYRVVEGTSDALEGPSCRLYQARATEYAARFNRRMLELISRSPGRGAGPEKGTP